MFYNDIISHYYDVMINPGFPRFTAIVLFAFPAGGTDVGEELDVPGCFLSAGMILRPQTPWVLGNSD